MSTHKKIARIPICRLAVKAFEWLIPSLEAAIRASRIHDEFVGCVIDDWIASHQDKFSNATAVGFDVYKTSGMLFTDMMAAAMKCVYPNSGAHNVRVTCLNSGLPKPQLDIMSRSLDVVLDYIQEIADHEDQLEALVAERNWGGMPQEDLLKDISLVHLSWLAFILHHGIRRDLGSVNSCEHAASGNGIATPYKLPVCKDLWFRGTHPFHVRNAFAAFTPETTTFK